MKFAILLIPLSLLAAEKQPEPVKPAPAKVESKALTREQSLMVENLNLRRQLLTKTTEDLERDQNEFVSKACADAGFPVAECAITPTQEGLRIVHRPAPKVEAKPAEK